MKATALSVIMSTLSLAGVGLLYVEVQNLSESVSLAPRSTDSRSEARGGEVEPLESDERFSYSDTAPGERDATPRAKREKVAENGSFEERLDALEKKYAKTKSPSSAINLRTSRLFPSARYYMGTDQLAKDLNLTTNQKDRVTAIFKRGRELIQDVMKIPDEDGKSPYERRQEAMKRLREEASKNPTGVISLMGNMMGHNNKKIPGRNATYGEEIDRIKKETREDVNSVLNAEQQEKFKDANVDTLTGGHGGTMATSIFVTARGNMDHVAVEGDLELTEKVEKEE